MGKFRGHQDKSRRAGKTKLRKKMPAGGGSIAAGGKGEKAAGNNSNRQKSKHVTYSKEHSVLICGDGDFSFTRGVIQHRGMGAGVVATSLDSRRTVLKKYPHAESWLPKLEADGAQIVHAVDATRLEVTLMRSGKVEGAEVQQKGGGGDDGKEADKGKGEGKDGEQRRVLFDRVVFNFPHTGTQRIHLNRNLVRDFFASTKRLVKCATAGGEVHVTLKDRPPYSGWNIRAMAKESDLVMIRSLAFNPAVFPGYRHRTTDPQAKEFDSSGARTHVFCRGRSSIDDEVDDTGAFPGISRATALASSRSSKDVSMESGVDGTEEHVKKKACNLERSDAAPVDTKKQGSERWVLNADDSPLEEDALVSEDESEGDLARRATGEKRHTRGEIGSSASKMMRLGETGDNRDEDDAEERADAQQAGSASQGLAMVKKKASKRRAQRKRAAESRRSAAEAPEVNEGVSRASQAILKENVRQHVDRVTTQGDRKAKRKRGKYVRRASTNKS